MSDLLKGALSWAEMGVPVFPCGGNKAPLTENGFYDAVTDPVKVKELFDFFGSSVKLIGARMGSDSGLFCMDFDLYKGDEPRDYMEGLIKAGQLPDSRCHRTMNGGLHVFYYSDDEWPNLKPCAGVEVKGEGGYVIVPPSPGYEVVDGRQSADAPMGLLTELRKARDLMSNSTIDELKFAVLQATDFHDSLRGIAARLSSRGMDPVDVVIELKKVLAASDAADPEHSRHDRWRKIMSGNDQELSRIVKSGYSKFNAAAQTERMREIDLGGQEATASAVGFFPIPPEGELPEKEVVYDTAETPLSGAFASEDINIEGSPPVLYPIIYEGETGVIYAEPKAGKTAIALTAAIHVAVGEDLGSLKVKPHGKGDAGAEGQAVVYYALEGKRAINLRVEAWKKSRREAGKIVPDHFPMYIADGYTNLINEESRKDECAKLVAHNQYSINKGDGPIKLIVLDTLTKAMSGGDQNTVEDTSKLFDIISLLRSKGIGASILFIHHAGKDGKLRGSSNIEAEVDVALRVQKDEDMLSMRIEKARSIEDGQSFLFNIHGVELGTDPYGFPINSMVVEPSASVTDPSLGDTTDAILVGKRLDALCAMGFKTIPLEICVRTLHRHSIGPKTANNTNASADRWKAAKTQSFFKKLVTNSGRLFKGGSIAINLVYEDTEKPDLVTGVSVSPVGGKA